MGALDVMTEPRWAALDGWRQQENRHWQNNERHLAGYTRQRATAVWVGYPASRSMRSFEGGKVEGGTFPALIWHELMTAAMRGFESFPTPRPRQPPPPFPSIPKKRWSLLLAGITQELYDQLIDEPDYWTLALVEVAARGEPGRVFNRFGAGQIVPGGSTITLETRLSRTPPRPRSHRAERVGPSAAAGYEVVVDVTAIPMEDTPTPGYLGSRPRSGTSTTPSSP